MVGLLAEEPGDRGAEAAGGGPYWRLTVTSVPRPPGAGRNRTEPALSMSASPTDFQEISSSAGPRSARRPRRRSAAGATWPTSATAVVDDLDRVEVGHEPGRFRSRARRCSILGRPVDGERLADVDVLVEVVAAEEGVPLVGRVEPEGGVRRGNSQSRPGRAGTRPRSPARGPRPNPSRRPAAASTAAADAADEAARWGRRWCSCSLVPRRAAWPARRRARRPGCCRWCCCRTVMGGLLRIRQ